MRSEVWRHIPSGGPFPWEHGVDYTVEETVPNVFEYRYRACECPEETEPSLYGRSIYVKAETERRSRSRSRSCYVGRIRLRVTAKVSRVMLRDVTGRAV